jgi:hypothetical protein
MTTDTRPAFTVLGTTSDVTSCGLCGREDLKGTIALDHLDDDGNRTGDVVYYGSECGARAAGWTVRELRAAARNADDERAAAERTRHNAEHAAWIARRDAWIAEHIGPDALANPRKYGFAGPFKVVQAFREAVGE